MQEGAGAGTRIQRIRANSISESMSDTCVYTTLTHLHKLFLSGLSFFKGWAEYFLLILMPKTL